MIKRYEAGNAVSVLGHDLFLLLLFSMVSKSNRIQAMTLDFHFCGEKDLRIREVCWQTVNIQLKGLIMLIIICCISAPDKNGLQG